MWNPFKKRVKGVYEPQGPRMQMDFIAIMAIVIGSYLGLWVLSYTWGNWLNFAPIGPVMMIILFAAVIILALILTKKYKEGRTLSKMDFALVLVFIVLLVLGYLFLPDLAPELYQQSIAAIKTDGLQAFIAP